MEVPFSRGLFRVKRGGDRTREFGGHRIKEVHFNPFSKKNVQENLDSKEDGGKKGSAFKKENRGSGKVGSQRAGREGYLSGRKGREDN